MKVRHKNTGRVYEVQGNGVVEGRAVIIVDDTWLFSELLEPIPEERWQDVTGECEVGTLGVLLHRGANVMVPEVPGYRLSRVRVLHIAKSKAGQVGIEGYAFLIEKRVADAD